MEWATEWVLSIAGSAADAWRSVSMTASAACTVACDPLGRSAEELPLLGGRRRLGKYTGFTVQCGCPASQRIVAWFYRWHREPTAEDWAACCERFSLERPPSHVLDLAGGKPRRILVQLSPLASLATLAAFNPAPQLVPTQYGYLLTMLTEQPRRTRCGASGAQVGGWGDLVPAALVNVEKWNEVYADHPEPPPGDEPGRSERDERARRRAQLTAGPAA